MRTSVFLLFACTLHVIAGNPDAQTVNISLATNEISVRQLISVIENQTDFLVLFRNNDVDTERVVRLKNKSGNLLTFLDETFRDTDVVYEIQNKYIVLSKPQSAASYAAGNGLLQSGKRIYGTVVDTKGEAIIGANVIEKGTTNGVVTDVDGNFTLTVEENAVLQISFVGYITQEISAASATGGGGKSLIIRLVEDTKALDEVVVVAYGTQKARSVTGAMSKLNTDELSDMPVSNIGQKLQGKFSGVQIYQANGEPNAGLTFRIRGQASPNGGNSPLVVIDGFPSTTGMETLSPDEIENISILKDAASASLYGSRAANGVILITTKAAKAGRTNIEFSANVGWQNVGKRGRPDVMNAREFAQFKKEYYEDAAIYEGYTGGVPEVYRNPESAGEGTDWYDVLLRTAQTQNYNLSLTSGTDKIKSAVNVGYNKSEGVVLNTYSERFSARANNRFDASERITFGLNISAS
ncbi:MAG: SusC/RagA family TonB-linked outer membrane protein, partial [Tannerella sp.]|nr:SusC/RagA family TonB-linked outer membrane protein [Tannerella sp.]